MSESCYCGSKNSFIDCCEPFLKGEKTALSAEKLMRSRYTAYATQSADYLVDTTHVSTRKFHSKESILEWSKSNHWIKLEILNASEKHVEFKAYFLDSNLKAQIHHENSYFINENGKWFYVDGIYY